jgi:hypothetical protein
MPSTVTNIPYTFGLTGYAEDWTPSQQALVQPLKCKWSQRRSFVRDVLGYAEVINQVLHRHVPLQHPEATGLWASSARLQEALGVPTDDGDGVVRHRFYSGADGDLTKDGSAVYAVSFESKDYIVLDDAAGANEYDRYVVKRTTARTEAQQIPPGTWKWAGTTKILNEASSLPILLKEFAWDWLFVPNVPTEPPNLDLAVSKVNELPFAGCDAETLLMGPVQREPAHTVLGDFCLNIHFSMVHRPSGWNKFFHATDPTGGGGGAGYYAVVAADGGRKPYQTFDFPKVWSWVPA